MTYFRTPSLFISAPNRSAGKTTVSIALCRALSRRNLKVYPFKKGPDYIDPMWTSVSAGRTCRNLDFHMFSSEKILESYQTHSSPEGISIIEGNQGLFDGLDPDGKDSNAAMANLLGAPIILVVDTSRINRSIAPLLLGYKTFDKNVTISGLILNRVGSSRHEQKLRQAIENHVGIEIVGILPKFRQGLSVAERHLGLKPIKEDPSLETNIDKTADLFEKHCNIERLIEIAGSSKPVPKVLPALNISSSRSHDISIGVACDKAFNFYYPENISALENAGAKIVYFSPLTDKKLPRVDGLYLGGGFPEYFLEQLSANKSMLVDIHSKIEDGMPVVAECGGLVYLCNRVTFEGRSAKLVSVFDSDVNFSKRPVGLGYVHLRSTGTCPWLPGNQKIICHEFHHLHLKKIPAGAKFAWKVERGSGICDGKDGLIYKNVLAGFSHIHHFAMPEILENFVKSCRK